MLTRYRNWLLLLLALLIPGPLAVAALSGHVVIGTNWRTASRESAGLAPDPTQVQEAVLQLYAARAFSWRGPFAVHTWLASKPQGAQRYRVYQVVGWRQWRGLPVVVRDEDLPDRHWFGATPTLLQEWRGPVAAAAIAQLDPLVEHYPHQHTYTLFPGPNSNTFIAYLLRALPALRADLPVTAIGKDYPATGSILMPAISGTGYQISVLGLASITLARREGIEISLFGAGFGIGLEPFTLKWPGIGNYAPGDALTPRRPPPSDQQSPAASLQ
jgi:hypothetical protein